ncbi:hypothetical protein VTK73DRAFT_165 [Phialemonium thermophilum]|uniref:Zn(2)-C6 fungal-type domain-containing protein n=1 Tax=Phialemonium thermophilum TaxID=223376 RepID=A0ABR3VWP4_9PEZI
MSGLSPSDADHSQGVKRRREAGAYQRRRAVAACQPCRLRKTKCDNMRPVCGFCQRNGGQCVYLDSSNDYSSFDPASLAILARINHVVSLLEARPSAGAGAVGTPPSSSLDAVQGPAGGTVPTTNHQERKDDLVEDDLVANLYLSQVPRACLNCEGVLAWPVFQGFVPDVVSFILDLEDNEASPSCEKRRVPPSGGLGRGVQEDDIIPLSKRFLAYVHVKNPILDVPSFKVQVKRVAENGPGWDGTSCLVLIACALGCLASPFHPNPGHVESPGSNHPLAACVPDHDAAMSYYLAAKKRLGLLQPSLDYLQCLFLSGVFEMYLLRPVKAWFYFNQACVQIRNLQWRREHEAGRHVRLVSQEAARLEQRLYWSCLKSEFEIRCEIPLPASGLTRFNHPNMFPSPPTELSSPASQQPGREEPYQDVEPEEERSWFYYLAEISYRRMMDRAIAVLARNGQDGWIRDIRENVSYVKGFNEQIDVWNSHLPPEIDLNNTALSNNELAFFVQNRALSCREWIHRPFVYYVVHQPAYDPYVAQAMPLAKVGLQLCCDLLLQSHPHHRHHGTWLATRSSATRALILIAAARSRKIALPDRWREAVEVALSMLRRWSSEAPDLEWAASVCDGLLSESPISPVVYNQPMASAEASP